MRAHAANGTPPAALTAYDDLARRLRADLGTDPETGTRELHLALLRGLAPPAEGSRAAGRARRPQLVGRETELGLVDDLWARAGEGAGSLVLIEGAGGQRQDPPPRRGQRPGRRGVASCYEPAAARPSAPCSSSRTSTPCARSSWPRRRGAGRAARRAHRALGHVPAGAAGLVAAAPSPRATRTSSDVAPTTRSPHVLRGLARRRPVLLALDDLQEAGSASIDLLGYVAGRLADAGVLLAAAVRSEDAETVDRLADRATRVEIGPLPPSAVDALASAAGLSARAPEVLARTAGHALSVVECLRALADRRRRCARHAGRGGAGAGRPARRHDAGGARGRRGPRRPGGGGAAGRPPGGRRARHCAGVRGAGTTRPDDQDRGPLRVRQRPGPGMRPRVTRAGGGRGVPPSGGRPDHRPAGDDGARTRTRPATSNALPRAGCSPAGPRSAARPSTTRRSFSTGALEVGESPLVRTRVLLARARTHEARTSFAAALDDVDEALRPGPAGR